MVLMPFKDPIESLIFEDLCTVISKYIDENFPRQINVSEKKSGGIFLIFIQAFQFITTPPSDQFMILENHSSDLQKNVSIPPNLRSSCPLFDRFLRLCHLPPFIIILQFMILTEISNSLCLLDPLPYSFTIRRVNSRAEKSIFQCETDILFRWRNRRKVSSLCSSN